MIVLFETNKNTKPMVDFRFFLLSFLVFRLLLFFLSVHFIFLFLSFLFFLSFVSSLSDLVHI